MHSLLLPHLSESVSNEETSFSLSWNLSIQRKALPLQEQWSFNNFVCEIKELYNRFLFQRHLAEKIKANTKRTQRKWS